MFIVAPSGTSPTLAGLRVTGALTQRDASNEDEDKVEEAEEDAQEPAGTPIQYQIGSQHHNWHI